MTDEQPKHAETSGTVRLARVMLLATIVSVVIAICAFGLAYHANNKYDDANASKTSAQAQAGAIYSQAASAGITPVATPSGAKPADQITGPAGPSGATGPTGPAGATPSFAEIATAVKFFCGLHKNCTGTPSQTQVMTAVTAFCNAGACRGMTGATGSAGPSGASGASGAPGLPGAPPTSDQITDAIGAYCTVHSGCTGPAGPKGDTGATGATGPPGRGIQSITCSGLTGDTLYITYTDGTTATVTCTLTGSPTDTPS